MLTLTFGKMRKRPNSTKRDISDAKTVENVCLKENVDVKAPTFKVNFDTSDYNYVIWGDRYYYIDNTIYVSNGLWEVKCSLDILATYKNLLQYGSSGKCLYCTNQTFWDQYYDDLRFSPSSLSTYDPGGFDTDDTWMYSYGNIFGTDVISNPKLWDATYDSYGNVTSYGDGCYLLQTAGGGSSTHNYLFDKTTFNAFLHGAFSGISNLLMNKKNAIQIANWLPISYSELVSNIPSAKACTRVYIGIDFVDLSGNVKCVELPEIVVLDFDSSISIPKEHLAHPIWMENGRWNKLILQTPSGNTELNLDMMYPISGAHTSLTWHTTFDVISGEIDTKYMYDVKNGWSTLKGSIAYESKIDCSTDVMDLIQKTYNVAQVGVVAGLGATMAAGTAMIAGPAAVATAPKVKQIATEGMSAEKLEQANVVNSMIAHKNATIPSTNTGSAIGQVVNAAGPIVKLTPNTDTSVSSFQVDSSFVSLFNNNQLGSVSLRLKPLRCKELISGYSSYYEAYIAYCSQYGFPVNAYWTPGSLALNHFYVFDNPQLSQVSAYTRADGLTDEEQTALLQSMSAGFWLE